MNTCEIYNIEPNLEITVVGAITSGYLNADIKLILAEVYFFCY